MAIPKLNDSHGMNPIPQKSFSSPFAPVEKSSSPMKSIIPLFFLLVILSIAVGILGYLYWDSMKENKELKSQQNVDASTKEYQEVVDLVKKLIDISDSERVNVAVVDNTDALKEQNADFYKNVQNGQYLVVMPETQRVLIYDKAQNKIINFSSYTIKVDLIPEDQIEASEKPLSIEIRYTADVPQETLDSVVAALKEASPNYNITGVNMTSNTYAGLTVVLLKRDSKPKMSQNIIAHSGTNSIAEILPQGEAASTSDVVIIIGKI